MSRPSVLNHSGGGIDSSKRERRSSRAFAEGTLPEARQRQGKALVLAGWVVALIGVVACCAASFAAEPDADLAAILFHGAVPVARAGLLAIGAGTLMWIVGSVLHATAVVDADAGAPGAREE